MKSQLVVALGLAGCVAATAVAARSGADKVAFPANLDKAQMYGTVDRPDVKQVRELWAPREVIEAVRAGKPIPYGAPLTMALYKARVDDKGEPVKGADGRLQKTELIGYFVMEKRQGWGAQYPAEKRNGEWEYQAFTADRKVNDKAQLDNCFACHKQRESQDYVFSMAKLAGRE
ncbi:MAG TPA: cytochrome P460 family protein [Burkholderiaceae bacterium]|jgi:hypothetical protein|nr:cytochrome P460 family protein [Burkholderiaceae bacterium]